MPIRAWLSFSVLALTLAGCNFPAVGQSSSDISTQAPKGYAVATNIPKEQSWEEKVQAAMKAGVEAQAQAAEKPPTVAKPAAVVKPEKVAEAHAPAARHAKRSLTHLARHKSRIGHKAEAKPWYKRMLGK